MVARQGESPEVPTVKLGKLKEADYDKPRKALPTPHFGFDALSRTAPCCANSEHRRLGRAMRAWPTSSRRSCALPLRPRDASRWPSRTTAASHRQPPEARWCASQEQIETEDSMG